MQKALTLILWSLLLTSILFVYADAGPHPGGSPLDSYISNMNESQDYVLIAAAQFADTVIYRQCSVALAIIGEDGLIPDPKCYRDDISLSTVYAIKKTDFSIEQFEALGDPEEKVSYVFSLSPVAVIDNVPANTAAARNALRLDTSGKYSQYYTIDFAEINNNPTIVISKTEPDKLVFEVDYSKIILGFALTFITELIIILIFMRKSIKKKLTKGKIALYVFLINIVTWPIANYLLYAFLGINFLIVELLVIVAESFLLLWALNIKYKRALLISFVANLASFLVGLALSAI